MRVKWLLLTVFCCLLSCIVKADNILLETEAFSYKGGWKIDQQFMDQMGSPYLIAHGMGHPVADAHTTFSVTEEGIYKVYVRTYNWTSPWFNGKGAGRFAVRINNNQVGIAGDIGSAWGWVCLGTARLRKGVNAVLLRDLTGLDGRCDAIFLSKNGEKPHDGIDSKWRQQLNPRKKTAQTYDFVVIGGGIAGMCAAASAARLGLRVALVNDRPVWGGCNSSDIRVHLGGDIEVEPYRSLGRLINELGPSQGGNAQPASRYEDNKKDSFLKAQQRLFLYPSYRAVSVSSDENKIKSVIIEQIENGNSIELYAPLFADCTGDATVGYLAGADFRMGREGKNEFGEERAPEAADSMTMGASVQWYSVKGKEKFPEFDYGMGFNDYNCDNVTMGEWTWETGMDKNQIAQAEQIRDYGLMAVYGTWSWLKNHSVHKADFRDRKLGWVAYVSGKRESRRLLGDYILKWDDIMKNVYHEDASFSTTWSIDLHFPDSLNNAQFPGRPFKADTRHTLLSAPYPVPYRCLYSRNVDNLFMAGRDISVTHVALGTTRVMRTCGMEGEVVGMAASLCHKYQVTPRMIYWNYLNELKRLMSEGTGLKNVPFNQGYNTWNKWNRHR